MPAHRVWGWAPPGLPLDTPSHHPVPARMVCLQIPLASCTEPSAQGMLLPPSVTVIYCLPSARSNARGTRQLGNVDPALDSSLLPLAHIGFFGHAVLKFNHSSSVIKQGRD